MPAIGVHHTEVKDGTWDGPAAKAALKEGQGESYYREAFAWEDPKGDPKTKSAYKFIHHFVTDGKVGAASKIACSAGIAILNGGRGGAFRPTMERRTFDIAELRAEDSGEGKMPVIRGHAAVFNQPSEEMGGFMRFREQIAPGTFKDSIKNDDIRALFNHDPNFVLGRNKAKTMKLREDDTGLAVEITPPETNWARDLVESIRRGDISQMSFGFDVQDDSWDFKRGADEPALRTLRKVKLYDVSPVTYPAYPQTDVNCRSLDSIFEDGLRTAGMHLEVENRPDLTILRRRLDLLELE